MKYVKFQLWDYPKFAKWGCSTNDAITWPSVFKVAGYKTATLESGYITMREDEYTWFVLKWS